MADNIFARAADILEIGGHCKFGLEHGTAHCALGALLSATGAKFSGFTHNATPEQHAEAMRAADEAGAWRFGSSRHGAFELVSWNNAPETTGEDVINLFRELAGPRAADIGEEEAIEIEFEPLPETAPTAPPVPAEPVPA